MLGTFPKALSDDYISHDKKMLSHRGRFGVGGRHSFSKCYVRFRTEPFEIFDKGVCFVSC